MPMTTEPVTPRAYSPNVKNSPRMETMATGLEATDPSVTSVAGSATTTPIASSPMIARNSPMPVPTASFTGVGKTLMTYSRAPTAVSAMKRSPSTTTAASAVSHGTPSAPTTVNAKKALSPSPGACPKGRFAYNAMISVATAAAIRVTTATICRVCAYETPSTMIPGFSPSMPTRMLGFTKTM